MSSSHTFPLKPTGKSNKYSFQQMEGQVSRNQNLVLQWSTRKADLRSHLWQGDCSVLTVIYPGFGFEHVARVRALSPRAQLQDAICFTQGTEAAFIAKVPTRPMTPHRSQPEAKSEVRSPGKTETSGAGKREAVMSCFFGLVERATRLEHQSFWDNTHTHTHTGVMILTVSGGYQSQQMESVVSLSPTT